jgi:D-alanyl-D-alanine carboxypeptidase
MTRRSRLIGGWALGLAAVLLLNLTLHSDSGGPGSADAAPFSSSPVASASATDAASDPALPSPVAPPSATAEPISTPISAAEALALADATERGRRAEHLNALVVGLSVDGLHDWSGGSGFAADGVTPLDGGDPFVIASITKTFTATLVLQLVEEGQLALSDLVADRLPELDLPPDVTVEQLLDHTSGIPDLLAPMRPDLNATPSRVFSPTEVLAHLGPPSFPAGTDWAYSNTNYLLLGMLVERITGSTMEAQLQQRLLDPLGLDGTGMLLTADAPQLLPPAWASAFRSSGAMYSTAEDLLRWGDALYGSSVLSAASRARMLDFGDHGYGLGAQQLDLGPGRTAYGHSGLLKGFISLLVRLPDEHLTLVLLATSTHEFDPMQLLQEGGPGEPSILDLALAAAGRGG